MTRMIPLPQVGKLRYSPTVTSSPRDNLFDQDRLPVPGRQRLLTMDSISPRFADQRLQAKPLLDLPYRFDKSRIRQSFLSVDFSFRVYNLHLESVCPSQETIFLVSCLLDRQRGNGDLRRNRGCQHLQDRGDLASRLR
jgi:hypothetical protein